MPTLSSHRLPNTRRESCSTAASMDRIVRAPGVECLLCRNSDTGETCVTRSRLVYGRVHGFVGDRCWLPVPDSLDGCRSYRHSSGEHAFHAGWIRRLSAKPRGAQDHECWGLSRFGYSHSCWVHAGLSIADDLHLGHAKTLADIQRKAVVDVGRSLFGNGQRACRTSDMSTGASREEPYGHCMATRLLSTSCRH